MPSVKIFKDKHFQDEFDCKGFLVVNLLNEDEVNSLNQIFDMSHVELPKDGFFTSAYSYDMEYKKKSSDEIVSIVNHRLFSLLENFEICGADFIFKMPSKNSQLDLHQDWSFVDEEKYVSINCWIPLCDINNNNGAIHVLPGSHFANFKTYRSPSIRFFFKSNEDNLMKKLIPLYVSKGQAIFINHSLVHYSPPNLSNEIRKAVVIGVKSAGAQMYFLYYDKKNKMLEYYQQESNYAEKFENFSKDVYHRPKFGNFEKKVKFSQHPLGRKELDILTNTMLIKAGYPPYPLESFKKRIQINLSKLKHQLRSKLVP